MGCGASANASPPPGDLPTAPAEDVSILDLVFIRHCECFHTAAVGVPSAVMMQYLGSDPAARASVEALVTHFSDPIRLAQGEWKTIAAQDSRFAVLTKADTPLLPSALASGIHLPRLQKTTHSLLATGARYFCASPPLLRMMCTAAIAASMASPNAAGGGGGGGGGGGVGLRTAFLSATMLPRPSPLHSASDITALAAAASRALASAKDGAITDEARSVLGSVDDLPTALSLLAAHVSALDQYTAMQEAGGFVADDAADTAASEAAGGGGSSGRFARWAFAMAAARGCSNLIAFGGSGWWASLIRELNGDGGGLGPDEIDVLLPLLALDENARGPDGKPIALPLLPPPAGARYVRLVRRGDTFSLCLPTAAEAHAEGNAFAATATGLNPVHPGCAHEGAGREAWLRGLLSAGESCTY